VPHLSVIPIVRQYKNSLLGILLVEVLVFHTLTRKGYAKWGFSRWFDMPTKPLESYQPNPDGVIEQYWLR
jgi:hypothetical protein